MINILPQEEKRALRREYRMRFVVVVCILLFLTFLFASIMLVPPYLLSLSKDSLAENRLATWNALNKDISLLDTTEIITDTNTKLGLLSGTRQSNVVEDVFNKVLLYKTSGITFQQMLYTERSDEKRVIEIHGIARDRFALRAFKDTLESSKSFSKIEIPLSTFLEKSNIAFTVSLIML